MKWRVISLVLVAVLSAITLSAAASSATAAIFTLTTDACTGGTNVALCYENAAKEKLELTGTQSETVEGGEVVLTVLTAEQQIIKCAKSTGSGTISQTEPLKSGAKTTLTGTLTYKECKITAPASIAKKCKVEPEKTTKALKGTLIDGTELMLAPETGTVFIEIIYSNNGAETCPATFIGTRNVTGTQRVEIINPFTAEAKKKGKAVGETLEFFSTKTELSQELTMSFTGLGDEVYISEVA